MSALFTKSLRFLSRHVSLSPLPPLQLVLKHPLSLSLTSPGLRLTDPLSSAGWWPETPLLLGCLSGSQ